MSDFPTGSVESLCTHVVDCPHSTPKWTDSGVVVLRSKNIRGGRLNLAAQPSFTTEEGYRKRVKRAVPGGGDLVITREAPMGEVCILPEGLRCCLGQRMVLLRPDDARVHGSYLLFALQSRQVQHQIMVHEGTGSTVSNLRIPSLKALQIPTPSLPEQRRIAAVLGALDDKIELNRKMNRTLEEMAQALFKSWFIDFDGHDPEGLVDSELGPIPRGWSVGAVSDLATLTTVTVKPQQQPTTTWEHYSIPAYDEGRLPAHDLGASIKSNKYAVPAEAILVSKLNPRFPRVWMPNVDDAPRAICSTEFMPFVPTAVSSRAFVFDYFWSPSAQQALLARVTGTTGSRQRVKPKEIAAMPALIPDQSTSQRYGDAAAPMHLRRLLNIREARTLAELRDTLLPKLISGELRVPEAEEMVEAAR